MLCSCKTWIIWHASLQTCCHSIGSEFTFFKNVITSHYWGCGGHVSCSIPMCCWLFGLCHDMYSFQFNVCSASSLSSFLRSRTNTLIINQTKLWIHTRNKNFGLLYSSHAITEITLVEFCDVDWHKEVDSGKITTFYTFHLEVGLLIEVVNVNLL
jgi:hypothetical protein